MQCISEIQTRILGQHCPLKGKGFILFALNQPGIQHVVSAMYEQQCMTLDLFM
jgi:hypothetical protein